MNAAQEGTRITTETEVTDKAKRRRFSAAEKKRILEAADRCEKPGELGALLRREGIYSSHLAAWRKARRERGETGLEAQKRGPKAAPRDGRDVKVAKLERENLLLARDLERMKAVIEIQKTTASINGWRPDREHGSAAVRLGKDAGLHGRHMDLVKQLRLDGRHSRRCFTRTQR